MLAYGATLAYGACCVFSLAVVAVSTQPLHRLWGACAAAAYGCAALVWLTRFRWRRELALTIALAGALAGPLCWLTATGRGMPEVGVVAHSAGLLVQHGRPYESAAQLSSNVNGYNPYLPGMALFGLPQAIFGGGVVTDPRVWDGLAFVVTFAAALRVTGATGATGAGRRTAALASSPLIAFPLTVSGNDLPVIGLICLGLALAARQGQQAATGLVLGAGAALKATAWPALVIVGVLIVARQGRNAVVRFAAGALVVLAVVAGPFLVIQPRDLIENTIAFPLGLTKAHSPAASPLPGHLLAATGQAGHLAVIALMIAAATGTGVALVVRPPRSAVSAAGYVAGTLTMLFALAPATRWGYFAYPIGIGCWSVMSGRSCPLGLPRQSERDEVPVSIGSEVELWPTSKGRELRSVAIPGGELHERFSRIITTNQAIDTSRVAGAAYEPGFIARRDNPGPDPTVKRPDSLAGSAKRRMAAKRGAHYSRENPEGDAMSDTSTPQALATALAYHQAWTGQNLDQAMTYIADGITCDAPGGQISGAQQYRTFLGGFMTQLTGVQTVAAFGDNTTAVLFYYPHTANISDAPTAECFTVTDGKIARNVLVFDRPSFAPRST